MTSEVSKPRRAAPPQPDRRPISRVAAAHAEGEEGAPSVWEIRVAGDGQSRQAEKLTGLVGK